MKNTIASICLVGCLSGCATVQHIDAGAISLPADHALMYCDDVSKLNESTLSALVKNHVDLLKLYKQCKDKHKDLVDFVKQEKGV